MQPLINSLDNSCDNHDHLLLDAFTTNSKRASSGPCRIQQSKKLYFSKGDNYTIDYNSTWEKYAILVRLVSFGLSSRNLFYIRNIICRSERTGGRRNEI